MAPRGIAKGLHGPGHHFSWFWPASHCKPSVEDTLPDRFCIMFQIQLVVQVHRQKHSPTHKRQLMSTLQGVQCKLLSAKDCKLRNIGIRPCLSTTCETQVNCRQALAILKCKHEFACNMLLNAPYLRVLCVCAYSTCGALYACDTSFGCVHMLCVQVLCTHVIRCTVCMFLLFAQEEWQSFAFWLPGYHTLQKHNCQYKVACLTMYALCASRPCLPRPFADLCILAFMLQNITRPVGVDMNIVVNP